MAKSMRLGGGGRFAAIAKKAAKRYGSKAAGRRVAAAIARNKYGNSRVQKMAAAGRHRAAVKRHGR